MSARNNVSARSRVVGVVLLVVAVVVLGLGIFGIRAFVGNVAEWRPTIALPTSEATPTPTPAPAVIPPTASAPTPEPTPTPTPAPPPLAEGYYKVDGGIGYYEGGGGPPGTLLRGTLFLKEAEVREDSFFICSILQVEKAFGVSTSSPRAHVVRDGISQYPEFRGGALGDYKRAKRLWDGRSYRGCRQFMGRPPEDTILFYDDGRRPEPGFRFGLIPYPEGSSYKGSVP